MRLSPTLCLACVMRLFANLQSPGADDCCDLHPGPPVEPMTVFGSGLGASTKAACFTAPALAVDLLLGTAETVEEY